MDDGKISLTAALAWAAWALSGVFALASLAVAGFHDGTTTLGMFLCTVAILVAGAAATIHVRSFLCGFSDNVRDAYRIGVERGRLEAEENVPLQRVQ